MTHRWRPLLACAAVLAVAAGVGTAASTDAGWAAFSKVYQRVADALPDEAAREAIVGPGDVDPVATEPAYADGVTAVGRPRPPESRWGTRSWRSTACRCSSTGSSTRGCCPWSPAPQLADRVLAAIASLHAETELRGVILDLRGNGGGSPQAVSTLLGALAHNKGPRARRWTPAPRCLPRGDVPA